MGKTLTLLLLVIWLATSFSSLAQRHVKHMASLGVHAGCTEKGKFQEISYASFLTDRVSLRLGGLREYGEGELESFGRYRNLTARLFVAPQLFQIGEMAYFHLLLGGSGSLECTETNVGVEGEEVVRRRFVYGPQAGIEGDLYLGNRFSLTASGTKGFLFKHTHMDKWPGFASVGLRYHFW